MCVTVWSASARVQVDDLRDRAAAHGAERNVVAGEHDAVGLRAEVAARFVVRALERADLARVRALVEQLRVALLLVAEERVHLRLRTIRGADRAALLLDLFRVALELVVRPRRRNRDAGRDEILPLE